MVAKKKAIWISYDFGLKADYNGLYTWLDNNHAVECGTGLAFCNYDTSELAPNLSEENVIKHVIKDLKEHVTLTKSDRLYIIWLDSQTNKVKGEFLSGARKQSPWEGYGKLNNQQTIDTAE
jgi:hypothetical protein